MMMDVTSCDDDAEDDLIPCSICNRNRKQSRKSVWIQCTVCPSWFHVTCVGLKVKNYKLIPNWRCSACCAGPLSISSRANLGGIQDENETDILTELVKARQNRIVKRIPKGARNYLASELAKLFNDCAELNTPVVWEKLILFSWIGMQVPGNTDQKISLTTRLKSQVDNYVQGVRNNNESCSPSPTYVPPVNTGKPTNIARVVSSKLGDGDVRGAVRILCSNSKLAPYNCETRDALVSKHPTSPPDINLPNPPDGDVETPVMATDELVKIAISSFPPGSAGGPDGLKPQHLKDLTSFSAGDGGKRLLSSITNVVNLILMGNVNIRIIPIIFGASLCALEKGGGDVRPVAVGNTIRRIAGKVASNVLLSSLGNILRPVQLGCGTKGGCEAIVHALRRYVNREVGDSKVILKVDYSNAFNTLRRDVMLERVKESASGAYGYMYQAYSGSTHLFYGEHLLTSASGVQQGDPLGPAGFALGVHSLATALDSELNLWYLDDATLGGSVDTVMNDLKRIVRESESLGLSLNFSKCELLIIGANPLEKMEVIERFRDIAPGVKLLEEETAGILGSPLFEKGIPLIMEEKRRALDRMSDKLEILESHEALYLLKNCLAIPRLLYTLRTAPIWKYKDILNGFDNVMKESLEKIVNINLNNEQWTQATLPVSSGGIGLRKAVDVSLPAFLGSVFSTKHLVDTLLPPWDLPDQYLVADAAVNEWKDVTQQELPLELADQRAWDGPIVDRTYQSLIQGSEDVGTRARFLAVATKESAAWLHAVPVASLGTKLDGDSTRIAISLRLGVKVCIEHHCVCGAMVGTNGLHGLSCRRSAGRRPRHEEINAIFQRAFISAGVPAALEPPGICRSDGKRPDGVTLFPWSRGKSLVWDATCTDPLAPSNCSESAVVSGSSAATAELRKNAKYSELTGNYIFVPLAFETIGPWGQEARNLIKELGRKIKLNTGDGRSTSFLQQRISLAIQRGNAAAVLGTVPPTRGIDEIFYCIDPNL